MGARTRRSRIDELLAQQDRELGRLSDQQARDVLASYDDARRALHERLSGSSTDGEAQRMRVMLAQRA